MNLNDKFTDLLEKANELNLIQFVFEYEDELYLCLWINSKWSDPMLIQKL